MKYFGPRSLIRGRATLIIVLTLTFLGLFSISRSSAQQEIHEDYTPARMRSEKLFGPFDYEAYLVREANGEFPFQGGDVPVISPLNSLTNNNAGASGTSLFTQSETAVLAYGNTVIVGFNDSGSNAGGSNKFTGFARSTDGGATFTDAKQSHRGCGRSRPRPQCDDWPHIVCGASILRRRHRGLPFR